MSRNVKIYQVRRDLEDDTRRDISFMSYDWVTKKVPDLFTNKFNDFYEVVYEFEDTEDLEKQGVAYLDGVLWSRFNFREDNPPPADYRGHSLSTSDVVALDGVRWFCDSFGWAKID